MEPNYIDGYGGEKTLQCGHVRADAEYKIQGFAGACVSLAVKAKASTATGEVTFSGETNDEAFAGASLSNEASFGVKWKAAYAEVLEGQNTRAKASEDQQATDDAFKSLLDVKPELAVSAGIGAAFDFEVFIERSKLMLYLKGKLVIGVGGGGGIAAEMNHYSATQMPKSCSSLLLNTATIISHLNKSFRAKRLSLTARYS